MTQKISRKLKYILQCFLSEISIQFKPQNLFDIYINCVLNIQNSPDDYFRN